MVIVNITIEEIFYEIVFAFLFVKIMMYSS